MSDRYRTLDDSPDYRSPLARGLILDTVTGKTLKPSEIARLLNAGDRPDPAGNLLSVLDKLRHDSRRDQTL